MKQSYFFKKTHVDITAFFLLIYITLLILFCIIFGDNFNVLIITSTVISLIFLLLMRFYKGIGRYIDNDIIYEKKIKAKNINVNKIKGIKVIQAYSVGGKYRGFYPIQDNNGNFLYTAILLKDITDEMRDFIKGDLWFNQTFKSEIITSSVYVQDAVEYLKLINPNIEIIG